MFITLRLKTYKPENFSMQNPEFSLRTARRMD